jgi:hypothetical protein
VLIRDAINRQLFLDSHAVDGLYADKGNNWAGHGHCNGAKSGECWQLVNRNDTLCQNSCVVIGPEQAAAYNKGKVALFAAAESMLRARGGDPGAQERDRSAVPIEGGV